MNPKHKIPARLFPAFAVYLLTSAAMVPATRADPKVTIDEKRIRAVADMLADKPAGFGRPIGDRAAWATLAKKVTFKPIISEAQKYLKKPIPDSPDDLYLEFSRTGDRTRWQSVRSKRLTRFSRLALAECLENQGRFLPALDEIVRALCAEKTWVYPAHDRSLGNFKGKVIDIDLGSSALAWDLATADYLLGDKLSSEIRQLIGDNVRRRVLDPFRSMATGRRAPHWWMLNTNNWNAVCLAGVTGSALTLIDSPLDRAFYIVAAEEYSKNFLKGFTADGYCSEGIGYWSYGFGHYLMLAEAIHQATGGGVDLLDRDSVRNPATYAERIEIINGVYPIFADGSLSAKPDPQYMYYISRRLGLGWRRWENIDTASPDTRLYEAMMFSFPNSASQTPPAPTASEGLGLRSWFDQAGVLICRPGDNPLCRMTAALKGGHNAEHHNHNDVGSYVVVVGSEPLLIDPGAEVYTARTFSSRRYESKVLNSFGHPVPMVAGQLQKTGSEACGRVLRTDFTEQADTLVLDISSAYPVPELKKLERTFIYSRRGTGALTVTDKVVFSSPKSFGTALITFNQWKKLDARSLMIYSPAEALRVDMEVTGGEFEIQAEEIHEDVRAKTLPIRLGINLREPVVEAVITVKISPLKET